MILLDPTTDPRWERRSSDLPGGLFQSPRWLRTLAATYGLTFHAAVVLDDDRVRSGVPYAVVDDARGRRVRALPFSDVVVFPLDGPEDWTVLDAHLASLAAPVQLAVPPGHVPFDDPWEVTEPFVWQVLPVVADDEEQLSRYRSNNRNRIRRMRRDGFTTRARTDGAAVDAFYDLHLGVRKHKHRLLPQPRSLFHHLAEEFFVDGRGAVITVERDGDVAAASIVAAWGDTAYYKFSASAPDHRQGGANPAVLHGAARWAAELGLERLDLGRSDLEPPGLVAYKDRMGAENTRLLRAVRPGPQPTAAGGAIGASLGRITQLLVDPRVPDDVVEAAGAELYRYFA